MFVAPKYELTIIAIICFYCSFQSLFRIDHLEFNFVQLEIQVIDCLNA